MNTATSDVPRIMDMQVTDEVITARLVDGRTISVPLAWSACIGGNAGTAKQLRDHRQWVGCALAGY